MDRKHRAHRTVGYWAYPVAIVVFGGFIVYQIYRFTVTGGFSLISLSLFDLIVIWLVWLEYKAVKLTYWLTQASEGLMPNQAANPGTITMPVFVRLK